MKALSLATCAASGKRRFFDFDGEVDVALLDVLTRFQFAARRVVAFAFLFFVHAVHHVGHPADAALDAAEFEIGEKLKHAFEHQGGELANLRERMLQRVADGKVIDGIQAERWHAQTAVRRHRHVEFLRFFPERIELRAAVEPATGGHRRQNRADHAQFR